MSSLMLPSPCPSDEGGKDDRRCRVCGDKAIGYNFGVVSCESCKAFFRRNGARSESISCPFSNNCVINERSRRFCQSCRLEKCIQVGMKWDTQGNDKKRKTVKRERETPPPSSPPPKKAEGDEETVTVSKEYLQRLLEKAKSAQTSCECRCKCGFYPPDVPLVAAPSVPANPPREPTSTVIIKPESPAVPSGIQRMPDFSVYNPTSPFTPQGSLSNWPPSPFGSLPTFPMPSASYQPSLSFPLQSVLSSSLFDLSRPPLLDPPPLIEYPVPVDPPVNEKAKYEKLSSAQRQLLDGLVAANERTMKEPLQGNLSKKEYTLMDAVKIVDEAIKRMVQMANLLPHFRKLEFKNRMNLIKGGSGELLIIRGVMAYNPEKNAWYHVLQQAATEPKGIMEMKLDILKGSPHYTEHMRFLSNMDPRVRSNEVVLVLIHAIILFNPTRPDLTQVKEIEETHNEYLELLLRVLECEYSEAEAQDVFKSIQNILRELHQINPVSPVPFSHPQGLLHLLYGLDRSELDPLIREVFGLEEFQVRTTDGKG